MRTLDRLLQRWRIAKAEPYIPPGARVLDIGCDDGALFRRLHRLVAEGVGVDPNLDEDRHGDRFRLLKGYFPARVDDEDPFDAIVMLAVVEHVAAEAQREWAAACVRLLRPGGRLIITVPSPAVDRILDSLKALKLIDGMATEEHYGFEAALTPSVFGGDYMRLIHARRFQAGLNHLFVFEREPALMPQ